VNDELIQLMAALAQSTGTSFNLTVRSDNGRWVARCFHAEHEAFTPGEAVTALLKSVADRAARQVEDARNAVEVQKDLLTINKRVLTGIAIMYGVIV
jgi:hypothetical protein